MVGRPMNHIVVENWTDLTLCGAMGLLLNFDLVFAGI